MLDVETKLGSKTVVCHCFCQMDIKHLKHFHSKNNTKVSPP